jgi:V/A-type H+/Na+-transporting ATPase subunit I
MSIVPLVKATLYGPLAEKDAVLDGLQRLGCLHLNDLRSGAAGTPNAASPGVEARAALQYLEHSPARRRARRREGNVDLQAVVQEVLDVRRRSQALAEERVQLHKWIADVEPWGDFEMPEWAHEGPLRLWFYVVPRHLMKSMEAVVIPWKVVARDHRFAYVVVVAAETPKGMPGVPASLEGRSLSQLRARMEQVDRELDELDYRRIGLTLYSDMIRAALDEADDRAERERAALVTREQDQLFAVQGWAPRVRVAALRQYAADRQLAVTLAVPTPQDAPPTLLDNPAGLRGGEGMVTFYKTPGYFMWDPSKAVFFGFVVFFAMIFSDAGYGLVLGIALLTTWKRLGRSAGGRDFRGVLRALVICSIVYGILVGSYFGVTPPAGSWLAALHVLDAEDQSSMIWIAISIGAAHLVYGNLVSAWGKRGSSTALSSLGWACVILGGLCAGLGSSYLHLAQLTSFGEGVLVLGGVLVLLFTSKRPFGLAPKLLFGRLADGLMGVTELSKAFGDVLSYLRLFALGLASIKLAEVFNTLAASSFALKGVGVLLGLLILLIGHSINFSMGIMSGVVHGLRLNVIEFFNWSLPEEGEQFRAFARKAAE